MSSNNLQITGDQGLVVNPTANGQLATLTSLTCQATTASSSQREFLVNVGLVSNKGSGTAGNARDKVPFFSGLDAVAGTGDVWSLYSTLGQNANSGTYNAQGYELDLNNFNAHRGNSGTLGTDFGGAVSLGLSITGIGDHSNTTGLLISSQSGTSAPQWNRGISIVGKTGICNYQDWCDSPVGIQFDGSYSTACINLTPQYGNPGANSAVGMFLRNNMQIAWQHVNAADPPLGIRCDGGDNLLIAGLNCMFVGSPVAPITAGVPLGTPGNYWGGIYSFTGIVSPSDLSLKSNVGSVSSALDMVKAVKPISFQWADPSCKDGDRHHGFDAREIQVAIGGGAHRSIDGIGYVVKDELLPVLWQANRDLLDRIEALESIIKSLDAKPTVP